MAQNSLKIQAFVIEIFHPNMTKMSHALVWLVFLWAHLEVRMKNFPAPGIILAHLHLKIFALPGNGHTLQTGYNVMQTKLGHR